MDPVYRDRCKKKHYILTWGNDPVDVFRMGGSTTNSEQLLPCSTVSNSNILNAELDCWRADQISFILSSEIAEEGLEDTNPALPLAAISKPMPATTLKETLDVFYFCLLLKR